MFKFDLKSGYFHLDICPQQHTYLGFMWKGNFYCFTVLVFGISTGPYIFILRSRINLFLPDFWVATLRGFTMYGWKGTSMSGYFHLDICPQQHAYLGFMWKRKFYCFTVLVFGISMGPYIFTKCLRPMVKYWRENSVYLVISLDKLPITVTCWWSYL
jgi:ribosomal protein L31